MSLLFRRGIATMSSLKTPSKIVCIGRNYAYVLPQTTYNPTEAMKGTQS
jgi:hypothetical protein